MGRTEQDLTRLRQRLTDPETVDLAALGEELARAIDRVPKADAPLAPVLDRLAGWLDNADRDESTVVSVRSVVDAGIQYASRREHPQRGALLEAASELMTALEEAAAEDASSAPSDFGDGADPAGAGEPIAAGPAGLPAGFVGELPPESTLDDASLLLVQLDPSDQYGISSLVEILERLAVDADGGARERLQRAVRLLTSEEASEDLLRVVGELLEEVGEGVDTPLESGAASGAQSASPTPPTGEPEPEPEPEPAPPEEAATAWRPGADVDTDLMREFLLESGDLMRSAEQALLQLESEPSDGEAINVVFRAFHTIKGTSAFLGVEQAAELCHHAESLFSRVRDGAVEFGPAVADLSLASVDLLTRILNEVGVALDGGDPGEVTEIPALVERLQDASAGKLTRSGPTAPKPSPAPTAEAGKGAGTGKPARDGAALSDRESSVRVRTDRLDRLVDMVGELVIAQAMIAQDDVVRDDRQHGLAKKVAHGGKIVRELQDLSMALRMVPLKSTFSKLQRLVRDLARKSGKQVQLMTEGEETEIDRTMVDVLGDPLVHMIRNAMDHGIEPATDREAAGKTPLGTLWLRSYHAGGNVVVELEDDGRGMNRDRIVAKAVERGLIRSGDGMTDSEVWKLVFEPGFSTAEAITDVSGRGVGMDVVRRNIESLRGRIEVESTPGTGTKVTLRLPLTLAITEGMLMRVGTERYILPTLSIERNIRPTPEMLSTVTGRGEMLLLREELLPIVRLHELFGVDSARQKIEDGLLVVVGAAERRCALLVDELLGQQQVVVKSLGDGLGKVKGVTGGAVLGDGTVGLILDAGELVAMARNGAASQAA